MQEKCLKMPSLTSELLSLIYTRDCLKISFEEAVIVCQKMVTWIE